MKSFIIKLSQSNFGEIFSFLTQSVPLTNNTILAEWAVAEGAFAGHQQIADVAPSSADRATESRRAKGQRQIPRRGEPPPARWTAGGARGDKKESRGRPSLPPPPIMQNIFRTTFRANFIVLWPRHQTPTTTTTRPTQADMGHPLIMFSPES